MSRMKIASRGKNFGLRAVVSTIIGETADSLVFFPIAFFNIVPTGELLIMALSQAGLKVLYEIIILPFTKIIVKKVKKWDNSDVYDEDISYNILKIRDL